MKLLREIKHPPEQKRSLIGNTPIIVKQLLNKSKGNKIKWQKSKKEMN